MKYNPNIHHRRSVRLRGYDYAQEGMYFITICTKNMIHFFGEVENEEMKLNDFGEIAHREWEKIPERWPHVELGAFQIMPNHMHGVLLVGRPYSAITTVENGTDKNGAITIRATTNWPTTRVAPAGVPPTIESPTDNDGVDAVGAPLVGAQIMGNQIVNAPIVGDPIECDPIEFAQNDTNTPNDPPEIPFSKIQWATRPYLGQILGAYKSIVATACLNHHKQNQPGVWLDKIWQRSFDDRIIWDASAFDNISNYIINNPKNWKEDRFF